MIVARAFVTVYTLGVCSRTPTPTLIPWYLIDAGRRAYFLPDFLMPCCPVFMGPLPPAFLAISSRAFLSVVLLALLFRPRGVVGIATVAV